MTDPTDWCYPSGIVAVLETFLLTPRAVGELMGSAPSYGELLSRARRSPVYAAVSASDAAAGLTHGARNVSSARIAWHCRASSAAHQAASAARIRSKRNCCI